MEKHNEDISMLIELYALGELDEDRILIVEEYLRKNQDAQRDVEDIRRITAAISAENLEEPSVRLADAARSAVHSLMERDRRRVIIPFARQVARFVSRPAFAAAAALVAISVCLFLIFQPTKPENIATPPAGPDEINKIGIGADKAAEYEEYIKHSADVFSQILEQNSDDFKKMIDEDQIKKEIGNAMYLLEKYEFIRSDWISVSLISDIESIWRSIKDFAEGKEDATFESIKNSITDTKVIERARWYEQYEKVN